MRNFILDAELVLLNKENQKSLPFRTFAPNNNEFYSKNHNQGQKRKLSKFNLTIIVFDCIYLNDEDLRRLSLDERKKKLEQIIIENPLQIMMSQYYVIKDKKELDDLQKRIKNISNKNVIDGMKNGIKQIE